ncbi:hypothetical protein [Flavobacterium microcysteis]
MKLSEEKVIQIAKQVMKDIDWSYETKEEPVPVDYSIERQIETVRSQKNHPRYNDYIATFFPYWKVFFEFPDDEGWNGRNMMCVSIKDDTGEPYELGHKQAKFKILKKDNRYYTEFITKQ